MVCEKVCHFEDVLQMMEENVRVQDWILHNTSEPYNQKLD